MNDEASKFKGLIWALAAVIFAACCAMGISPLVRAIPWSWEQHLAEAIGPSESGKVCYGNAKTGALLQKLVTRLYPLDADDAKFSIDVEVIDNSQINAFASLGGNIYVYSGLLKDAKSAEEAAGVLAHEIEHVKRRHILENAVVHLLTVSGFNMIFSGDSSSSVEWLNYILNMSFSRGQESQADEGGLKRLQTAHIDNEGFRDFFRRMEEDSLAPTFLSDHPGNQERYEMAERFKNTDTKPVMSRDEWLEVRDICHSGYKPKRSG